MIKIFHLMLKTTTDKVFIKNQLSMRQIYALQDSVHICKGENSIVYD